ncbi:MAG: AI-2E family transporter [Bacteroidetes bacterium]|nr:AI-2E family transporter [Bacteroidota bacterium]MBK8143832.1 AI-2E family transporter [Bacteroidota bacterium]MBP6314412.1 AI-2E family transporter [Chitinophagaceae bacterium]
MHSYIHPNRIRQILFLAVLIFLGIILYKELYFLLSSLFGAITLYVIMRNWMIKMITRFKMKKWLAALLLMLVSFVVLIIPVAWMVSVAYNKIQPFFQNPEIVNNVFEQIHHYLIKNYQIDILNKDNVAKINGQIMPLAQKTIGGTLSTVGSVVMMYLMLFFMLTETVHLELWIRKHLPFKNTNNYSFITEFRALVYSNALGIPIVAFVQGIVALIGYWIFGVESFVLMGMITAISSVIPVIGSAMVWIPLAIYTLSLGAQWQGVGVALWGFLVIGSVDNIARFVLQRRLADVHPLITIFGVIIGINLFGFIGVVFGPLLISMFLLLVKIYLNEFGRADADSHSPDALQ